VKRIADKCVAEPCKPILVFVIAVWQQNTLLIDLKCFDFFRILSIKDIPKSKQTFTSVFMWLPVLIEYFPALFLMVCFKILYGLQNLCNFEKEV
jgi:hypothetical protein